MKLRHEVQASGTVSSLLQAGVRLPHFAETTRYDPKEIQNMTHESSAAEAEINVLDLPTLDIPPGNSALAIRGWRRRIGFTQEELARALSVTCSTISRWENGHVRPSSLAWRAMAALAADRNCAPHAADSEPPDTNGTLEVGILRVTP